MNVSTRNQVEWVTGQQLEPKIRTILSFRCANYVRQAHLSTTAKWALALFLSLFLTNSLLFTSPALAKSASEGELQASNLLAEEISLWIKKLEKKPQDISIFSITTNLPLAPELSGYLEAELLRKIHEASPDIKLTTCPECRAPQVRAIGDRIIVTKGSPDLETLREIAKKTATNTFITIELFRGTFSLVAQVNLYQAASAEVLALEKFSVPYFDLGAQSFHFMFQFGPALGFGRKVTDYTVNSQTNSFSPYTKPTDKVAYAINLLFLDELGFGKGGINLGFITGDDSNMLITALPTIGWRGRIGASSVTTLFDLGLGLGLNSGYLGPAAGVGYTFFLGSFATLGVRGALYTPLKSNTDTGTQGALSLQIGLSLGR